MSESMQENQRGDDEVWTVKRLLEWTAGWLGSKGVESPRLDAEVLLAKAAGCSRIQLYTRFDEPVDEAVRGVFRALVRRRSAGEPVAYLTGSREFFSLPLRVTPAVLVPRPESELLVVRALDLARDLEAPRILDVGTGSGAIAVAIASQLPRAAVTATDIDPAAVALAGENAAALGVADRVRCLCGDLLEAVPAGETFDLIVSNPPYVREDEFEALPRDVREHEPRSALVAGPTGVEVLQSLVATAAARLAPGGWLLVEIGPPEASSAVVAASDSLVAGPTLADLAGRPRVVQARRADEADAPGSSAGGRVV